MSSNESEHEKNIFPYPGKTVSRVWDYFGFQKLNAGPPVKENLDMSKVICKICQKTYANKGTVPHPLQSACFVKSSTDSNLDNLSSLYIILTGRKVSK
jgi:hypothetical protein